MQRRATPPQQVPAARDHQVPSNRALASLARLNTCGPGPVVLWLGHNLVPHVSDCVPLPTCLVGRCGTLSKEETRRPGPLTCAGGRGTSRTSSVPLLGDLKIALRGGGGGVTWTPAEGGGGVGEMGFRVGPFVLSKNGCWRRRCRNTNFGPKKFFPPIISPPTFE